MATLCRFRNILVIHGPAYGYFPKTSKMFLVVKARCHANIKYGIVTTGVQLTENGQDLVHKVGQCHPGNAVGLAAFIMAFQNEKVATWEAEVKCLAAIAAAQPHAAYAIFCL